VYLDAIHLKRRRDGRVQNTAIYLILGVDVDGQRDVLGHWVGAGAEGANFWLTGVSDLRARGVEEIFIACIDGLAGFKEAIQVVCPQTVIERCIIHQIRASLNYVSWKDRKAFVADLKQIYQAPTGQEAELHILELGERWGKQYATVVRSWERNWEDLATMFAYPAEIRRLIYTTNTVEGYSRQLRKVTKTKRALPSAEAVREKEAYVYDHFASSVIPIPRVVHLGRLMDVHFAISEKAPGQNLLQIPRSEYLALIPRQIELLDAIHQIPVGDKPGYGIFDGRGVAFWPSWRSHLAFVREEEPAGDFYEGWHALFESSFLERDLFEHLYSQMMQLIGNCPEERYLVHGGYGFGNVLAQDGRITAILDWMDARYGDFLFDAAWLDFWSPEDEWHARFQQHYERMSREVTSYSERILCYQCYIALEALKFNAKAADRASYDYTRQRILSLLHGRLL
jgi:aminoglycoside phosphotransferase (APT) family kinase protein